MSYLPALRVRKRGGSIFFGFLAEDIDGLS